MSASATRRASTSARTWLAVDGNSWFAVDWYATAGRGKLALDNTVRRLRDITKQLQPERIVFAFDGAESWRRDLLHEYKSTRRVKPEGYAVRLRECIERISDLAGVEVFQVPKFEADDVIAAIAAEALADGPKLIMCSADRDLHQLLKSGQISQVTRVARSGPTTLVPHVMTEDLLRKVYGVSASQWVDYRVIVGDKADNLAGCPGAGEKAAKLVLKGPHDTLDAFWASPFSYAVSDRVRTALIDFRPRAELLRKVVRLRSDCLIAGAAS